MASQKLYKEIASIIGDSLDQSAHPHTTAYRQGVADTASRIADVLKADNPRFRYDKFFEAIGLTTWGQLPELAEVR